MSAKTVSRGASPSGIAPGDEAAAARKIREMFGNVAPRYDLLNKLLSARVDHYWRRRLIGEIRPYLEKSDLRAADLCCGTADVLLAVREEYGRIHGARSPKIIGSDFSRPMLVGAKNKLMGETITSPLIEADATKFPLPDDSLDLITIAFGFRNLTNYRRGIEEFARLLDDGGCLAILEFSQPTSPFWGPLFGFYFRQVLPRVGNTISGAKGAYSYLQNSVERFLTPDELAELMSESGFSRVEYHLLTGGISALHLAYR